MRPGTFLQRSLRHPGVREAEAKLGRCGRIPAVLIRFIQSKCRIPFDARKACHPDEARGRTPSHSRQLHRRRNVRGGWLGVLLLGTLGQDDGLFVQSDCENRITPSQAWQLALQCLALRAMLSTRALHSTRPTCALIGDVFGECHRSGNEAGASIPQASADEAVEARSTAAPATPADSHCYSG